MPIVTHTDWDAFLAQHPNAHLLQTTEWGKHANASGWKSVQVVEGNIGVQILFRPLSLGQTRAYIPKGPVGDNWHALIPVIDQICRQYNAIFLKIEPDSWRDDESIPQGFILGKQATQPLRTIEIDISGEEDLILARMKQKTRYNIRLATRKGVIIREDTDINTFMDLMKITSVRDEFTTYPDEYYASVYRHFQERGGKLLTAEVEHHPVASLMVFARGSRAWYLYGASSNEHRNLMPTYLLQWEAIRWARTQGCKTYDLWGVPDEDEATLEANFMSRSDGLWGVYRFKRGFGGEVKRGVGPWIRVYKPLWYRLYQQWAMRG